MTRMPPILRTLGTLGAQDQVLAGIVLLATSALLVLAGRAAWKALRRFPADMLLTFLAASLTSAVVATGMWHFAGEVLHFSGLERWLLFGILEITVLTCAVRARKNIKETGSAGPEGVAIWLVSFASGAFAATAAASAPEAAFRLGLPQLSTWLWERSLLPARRASGRQSRWHVWAERVLAKLGLGTLDLTADEDAAAEWRIAQLARAVVRAKRATKAARRWRRYRVDVLTVAANERAGLATRQDRRDLLLSYIGTLLGTGSLVALEPPAPWDPAEIRAAWERAQQAVPETAPEPPAGGPDAVPEDVPGDDAEPPQDRPDDRPGDGPEDEPQDDRKPSPGTSRKTAAVRLRPGHGKTAEELVPHVLAMLEKYGTVSRDRIKTDLRVGPDKAKAALDLARAEREHAGATVTQLHRDRAAEG